MGSAEFEAWKLYDQVEPGEPERGDWRAALQSYYAALATAGRDAHLPEVESFRLRFRLPSPDQVSDRVRGARGRAKPRSAAAAARAGLEHWLNGMRLHGKVKEDKTKAKTKAKTKPGQKATQ